MIKDIQLFCMGDAVCVPTEYEDLQEILKKGLATGFEIDVKTVMVKKLYFINLRKDGWAVTYLFNVPQKKADIIMVECCEPLAH